ncbi:dimethylsulfonioproprionate lyase family protein [Xanthocytophaga flava]|uniref:dimethylsulfonioproprionate lyase family protein n=1 Tax=Xanthocytophaga flava TaxID=3048013 RepID=UPI0028D2E269|nr:dimethylsulfonioproprionate lyase family protein [Xanthocytophaga flavus]MDJ1472417.1 dimethylsulfonioproprionate lyase family protein [Xanthocytophaga flavus]
MKNTSTNIQDYLVRKDTKTWQPLIENSVEYKGISVISLRYDTDTHRSPSILLRFEPGASYPYHNHPGGEEIYVVSGEAILENTTLKEGDYLYTPPGFKHSVTSQTGCTLLLIILEEVEILV